MLNNSKRQCILPNQTRWVSRVHLASLISTVRRAAAIFSHCFCLASRWYILKDRDNTYQLTDDVPVDIARRDMAKCKGTPVITFIDSILSKRHNRRNNPARKRRTGTAVFLFGHDGLAKVRFLAYTYCTEKSALNATPLSRTNSGSSRWSGCLA